MKAMRPAREASQERLGKAPPQGTLAAPFHGVNALLFLYGQVLEEPLEERVNAVRARRLARVPTVLTPGETQAVLAGLEGVPALAVKLLYGSGLRLMEALRLRVQDVDVGRLQVAVRGGKGGKDRVTTLAESLGGPLREHLERVRRVFEADRRDGLPGVELPWALERKYPDAGTEWGWQWVFPSRSLSVDPRSGARRRHHLDPGTLDKAIRSAVRQAGRVDLGADHPLEASSAARYRLDTALVGCLTDLIGHQHDLREATAGQSYGSVGQEDLDLQVHWWLAGHEPAGPEVLAVLRATCRLPALTRRIPPAWAKRVLVPLILATDARDYRRCACPLLRDVARQTGVKSRAIFRSRLLAKVIPILAGMARPA